MRHPARSIAEGIALDNGRIALSSARHADQRGDLLEFAIGKVDSAPLNAFPRLATQGTH